MGVMINVSETAATKISELLSGASGLLGDDEDDIESVRALLEGLGGAGRACLNLAAQEMAHV